MAAVLRFARATGDVHALSAVDVRLLALAHSLEVAYYGAAHLREQPPPPKLARKKVRESKFLPGWGAEGGEWAELDKLNEEELAAAEAALMAGGWVSGCWSDESLSGDLCRGPVSSWSWLQRRRPSWQVGGWWVGARLVRG